MKAKDVIKQKKERTGYVGWEISEASRSKILSLIHPSFERVIAHHITETFGVPESHPLPKGNRATLLHHLKGHDIECVTVSIDGSTERPNGQKLHITISLTPGKASPKDSNLLISGQLEIVEDNDIEGHPVINITPMFFS